MTIMKWGEIFTLVFCVIIGLFIQGLADPATLSSGEVESIFINMSPEERVGQIFMPAISSMDSDGTREMNPYLAGMLDRIHPGGVILFSRDLDSVEQVVRLTDAQLDLPPL